MGIGNQLRSDDGLGVEIIKQLEKTINKENIILINAETVPENFTGKIKKENPTHIIIIDAVIMEKPPGYIRIIKKEEIKKTNISTHSLSLNYLIKYLEQEKKYNILFIGIQPKNLNLTEEITKDVKESIYKLKNIILRLINET